MFLRPFHAHWWSLKLKFSLPIPDSWQKDWRHVLLIVAYRRTRFTASTPKGLRAPIHRCPHRPRFHSFNTLLSTGYLVLQSWASRSERKRYKRWWGRFQNFTPKHYTFEPWPPVPACFFQTARVFSAMLDELIMDATLQSHHEVARGRAVCGVCHTRYVLSCLCVRPPPFSLVVLGVVWCFLWGSLLEPAFQGLDACCSFSFLPLHDNSIPVRGIMISLMSLSPASLHAQMWLR